MKIRPEDYERLEALLQPSLERFPLEETKAEYQKRNLSDTRLVWDYFHNTLDNARTYPGQVENYLFLRSLHDYLNDVHIETALRKIILSKKESPS